MSYEVVEALVPLAIWAAAAVQIIALGFAVVTIATITWGIFRDLGR
jgi:hypothetical protein